MSIRTSVLWTPDGKAMPFFLAQWRARATQPIQPAAVLVDGGFATNVFRRLWQVALPGASPLPRVKIANDDGTATDAFWDAFP